MIKQIPRTELRIIGALIALGNPKDIRVQKAMLMLTEECFYNVHHRELFRMIKKAFLNNHHFDTISMLDMISTSAQGVFDYFTQVVGETYANFSNLEKDVAEVVDCMQLRKQTALLQKLLSDIQDEELISVAKGNLISSINAITAVENKTLASGTTCLEISSLWERMEGFSDVIMPTGIQILDNSLRGGFVNSSLVMLAAKPGYGKTNFSLYMLYNFLQQNKDKHGLFFSLEMRKQKIWERLIGVSAKKHIENLSKEEIAKAAMQLDRITIFDDSMPDIEFIETACRLKAMENPLGIVVIDYVGLLQSHKRFERNDLMHNYFAGKFAALALELNCIIVGLQQINRNADARGRHDRCPYPSDAADSSGYERSASYWIGLDRPYIYLLDESIKNYFVTKCRKNRFGDIFDIGFYFNGGIFGECNQAVYKAYMEQLRSEEKSTGSKSYAFRRE